MFHIDATFEDCRVIATDKILGEGEERQRSEKLDVVCLDSLTGHEWFSEMSLEDVGKLVAVASSSDPDDHPDYEYCCHLVSECPAACRPIP